MAYLQLFLGFIFILINFRINSFDIFPDFIGYILIFLALNQLKDWSIYYKKAQTIIILPLFLSIASLFFDFFSFHTVLPLYISGVKTIGLILFLFIVAIYNYILYYLIFSGIITHCKAKSKYILSSNIKSIFTIYSIIYLCYYASFTLNLFISIFLYFALLIMQIILLYSILKAQQEL